MKRCLIFFSIAVFLMASCSSPERKLSKINGDRIWAGEVDAVASRLMKAAHVTGLSLAVLNGNRTSYVRSYGMRTPLKTDSLMLGDSFSKAVFSYLVMQLF